MSHGVDPRLRKMVDYLGRTGQEVGVYKAIMSASIGNAAATVPGVDFTYGLSAMECMAGKFLTKARDSGNPALVKEYYEASDDVETFLPFSMFHLHSCFVMLGIGLAASMICCLLENFVYAFKRMLGTNKINHEDIDSHDTSRRKKQESLPIEID